MSHPMMHGESVTLPRTGFQNPGFQNPALEKKPRQVPTGKGDSHLGLACAWPEAWRAVRQCSARLQGNMMIRYLIPSELGLWSRDTGDHRLPPPLTGWVTLNK